MRITNSIPMGWRRTTTTTYGMMTSAHLHVLLVTPPVVFTSSNNNTHTCPVHSVLELLLLLLRLHPMDKSIRLTTLL